MNSAFLPVAAGWTPNPYSRARATYSGQRHEGPRWVRRNTQSEARRDGERIAVAESVKMEPENGARRAIRLLWRGQ
jgi:hypothetical protein